MPRPEIDVSIAHPARIHGFLLGGKDNYAADRAVAERLTFRSGDEVATFFAGFEPAEPALVDPAAWRPTQVPPTGTVGSQHFLAGVGVLPDAERRYRHLGSGCRSPLDRHGT